MRSFGRHSSPDQVRPEFLNKRQIRSRAVEYGLSTEGEIFQASASILNCFKAYKEETGRDFNVRLGKYESEVNYRKENKVAF